VPFALTKTFKIDIGHRIWNEDMRSGRGSELYQPESNLPVNKCAALHGHSLGVTFKFQSKKLDEHGFVLDSNLLKAPLSQLIAKLDHAMVIDRNDPLFGPITQLCDQFALKYYPVNFCPSFEALAKFFFDECQKIIDQCRHGEEFSLLGVTIRGAKMSVEATYERP
jgi:6-pyruvoyltetrahydropterin/6-carboxytetrahydropterin synthase